jgi:hypothetical protein
MEKVTVYLSKAQKRSLEAGKSIQLKASQLKDGKGPHHAEIHMHARHHKKLHKAMSEDKGFRFTPGVVKAYSIDGGALFDTLKRGASKAGKWITHNVDKDLVKKGLSAAALAGSTALGHPELGLLANSAIDHGVDAAYGHKNKKQSVKDYARESAQHFVENYARENHPREYGMYETAKKIHKDYGGYSSGSGVKFKKGSQEAKDYMAKLRAMRKSKGGSIASDLRKAFDPKRNGVSKAFKSVKSEIAPYIRPAITQALAAGADMVTGSPVGTLATPGISRGVDAALDKANIGIGLSRRKIHTRYGGLIGGIPTPVLTTGARDTINTMGLIGHKHGTKNGLAKVGGSFLPL